MTHTKKGITDRIRDAETEEEIDQLLREGSRYDGASQDTQTRWRKSATKRRQQLKGGR